MKKELFDHIIFRYLWIIIFIIILIICYQYFDISLIKDYIENSQNDIETNGIYVSFLILILRSFSILIPIVPGTYCAVIAGYIYGIDKGMLIMFVADLLACSLSFFISRKLGRGFVRKILGYRQMKKIENISSRYLENNFFLMTGFLMTSWFDFVCYAIGLTKLSWKKFMPALIISILISDLPFVAGGHTLSQIRGSNIRDVLSGDINVLDGPYLFILIISALIVFGLGMLNIFLKRTTKMNG